MLKVYQNGENCFLRRKTNTIAIYLKLPSENEEVTFSSTRFVTEMFLGPQLPVEQVLHVN